ncbi:hypothetical protein G9U51_02050 [Calidifontibacter sp. DB0510]|uniref:Uncharacterized protein n=1 Tax=Metallococcus carri TaxID=1656884 RepID=A0A967AY35_9MICO|nr:hypothetical protein [Metallococcus carri]NHN54562.1 hypothetical protein [Metallococcus carri]NOP36599.1 hypothetical protein [Calidifontibacter sp. DB2511S]
MRTLAGGVAVAVLITGSSTRGEVAPASAESSVPRAIMCGVRAYHSLREVAAYSTSGLIVRTTGERRVVPASSSGAGSAVSTIVTAKVVEVLGGRGIRAGEVVRIRQLGAGNDPTYGQYLEEILRPNATYAVFVGPVYFIPGKPTGEWVITNDSSFTYDPARQTARLYSAVGNENRAIPTTVTRAQLLAAATSVGTRTDPLVTKTAAP